MPSDAKPKLMGFIKKDNGQLWAKLVVRVNHLKRGRDVVEVFYPDSKLEALVLTVNGESFMNKYLPNEIIASSCEHSVSYGDKGKIKIKLRKAEAADWVNRWSPSRENHPCPSLASDSITSNSNSQLESSDSHNTSFKIEEIE